MNNIPAFRKTRIAPTPSGFIHTGNAFSFALTAALAQRTGAAIFLRIDDLDRERAGRKYIDDIFESLDFLRIPWQEGPAGTADFEAHYSQVHRMGIYRKALARLREEGRVYACTCSRAEVLRNHPEGIYNGSCRTKNIPLDDGNACWRLHTAPDAQVRMKCADGSFTTETLPAVMHNVVIRRKDGLPAYQLTSVLDDVYYGIDLVVRGEDLLPSTLVQLYLAELLGLQQFKATAFYHHALLRDNKGRKLSKSEGDTSLRYLRKEQNLTAATVYRKIGQQLDADVLPEKWEDLSTYI